MLSCLSGDIERRMSSWFSTCPTAPGATFASVEEYKEHYKTEWHRYNLRRKIAGLEMATLEQFEERLAAAKEAATVTKAPRDSHVKASKREARQKNEKRMMKDPVEAYHRQQPARGPEDEVDEEEEEEEEEEAIVAEALATDSIFDSKRFESVAESLEYMRNTYSFYLPEVEYLVDVEGCVLHLCQKVKQYRTCLYCERTFRSFRACQQHMIDKSHCKIAYDTDDQVDELSDFYDFSSSWNAYDDDDDDGDEVWEDASTEEDDDDEEEVVEKRKPVPKVSVLESGELLVQRGGEQRIVGARWLRKYYKQNFRLDDDRRSTAAVRNEETTRVLALYNKGGGEDEIVAKGRRGRDLFVNRGLALQFNKRAVGGVIKRDQRMQRRQEQMSMGMHSGRAKNNKGNKLIKHATAGKNRGEGLGVHG